MKRLVYSPKVSAYVRTDYGTFDVSEYITAGGVQRKLDQVSSAQITLRNPAMKWTEHRYRDATSGKHMVGPIFHPMDPISIVMTRLQNRPIQVFTGFLDKTPYRQLYPGTVTLQASCTLKKLMYTFFDPGLPFFNEFLSQHGWQVLEGVGIVNPEAERGAKRASEGGLNGSGLGELLYAVLHEIGGWPDSTLYIEQIPKDLVKLVTGLFVDASEESKASNEEMIALLHRIIGTASLGSGSLSPEAQGASSGSSQGTLQGPFTNGQRKFAEKLAELTDLSLRVVGAWCLAEQSGSAATSYEDKNYQNWLNIGPFAHDPAFSNPVTAAEYTNRTLHNGYYDNNILASVGKSDREQISAIGASPWGTIESTIQDTYSQCSVK